MVRPLPSGTVTFLFTDVEGSTKLWERHGELMRQAQRRHDDLLHEVIGGETGTVVKTMGDGLMAAFGDARSAVRAAIAGQRALTACDWDPLPQLRVRMGLHTAEATPVAGDYHGSPVNRAARIADAAHGGQVLVSGATAAAAGPPEGAQLVSLGHHRLRDLGEPLELFQVRADGLPDDISGTRTLRAGLDNLPIQRTSFVGRREEISEIAEALLAHRIVTLTGLGGVGKTRLALQAAAEVVFRFVHGVRLVELAPLPADADVAGAVIDALELGRERRRRPRGARDALDWLIAHLQARSLLLILDNCEHLPSQCAAVSDQILKHCPQVAVLVTSRSPLGVPGEHLYPLAPLASPPDQATQSELASDAFELFVDRASAARPKLDATQGPRRDCTDLPATRRDSAGGGTRGGTRRPSLTPGDRRAFGRSAASAHLARAHGHSSASHSGGGA
jgi:class 3 adenylate cyclase